MRDDKGLVLFLLETSPKLVSTWKLVSYKGSLITHDDTPQVLWNWISDKLPDDDDDDVAHTLFLTLEVNGVNLLEIGPEGPEFLSEEPHPVLSDDYEEALDSDDGVTVYRYRLIGFRKRIVDAVLSKLRAVGRI